MIKVVVVVLVVVVLLILSCDSYHYHHSNIMMRSSSSNSNSNRRSNNRSNRGSDGSGSSTNAVPFKTGRHTYASWQNPNSDNTNINTNNFDNNNNDNDEDNDEDNDYYDDNYSTNDSNDSNDSDDKNPLVAGLRKLYDVVFFYGLDSSIPKSSNRNRRRNSNNNILKGSSSMSSNDAGPSSRKMKSPFFTVGEQIGQELLGNPSLFDLEPLKDSNSNKESNRKNDNISNNNNSKKGSSSSSLLKDIERLDMILDDLALELQNIEVSISASEKDNIDINELERMRVFRNELLSEIEAVQVEYVTLRAQL